MNDANLHPSDDALLQWIRGEMVGEQAQVLEAHVAACPACSGRLADECALDVVMHAAGDLAADAEIIELAPATRRPAATGGWRQVAAAAAGFALLLMAGRGALSEAPVDTVDPALGSPTVVIADGPASWAQDDDDQDDAICEPSASPSDEAEVCAEPGEALVAMAMSTMSEPAPWSVMADVKDGGDDGPCTTPVDTGESLTCDDWLPTDDFSG